jgi:methylase of polypeptide subunit release factors
MLAKPIDGATPENLSQRDRIEDAQCVVWAPPASPSAPDTLVETETALLDLGRTLKALGYQFTTITPASHARVVARKVECPASLVDIFGWSRPFRADALDARISKHASAAGIFELEGVWRRSCVRFSTIEDQLYVHSAYPTQQTDDVFFGPDTYRFCRAINSAVAEMAFGNRNRPFRILDVGAGSGAGGLHAASLAAHMRPAITLTDINPRALRYCRINAAINGIESVNIVGSDLFREVRGSYDLIVANPPYLVDELARTYRHGGGALGSALSLRIIREGVPRLAPGGRLVLYTGSAILNGRDHLHEAVAEWSSGQGLRISYEEIDPDVFGEELDHPPYDRVDRIAVVSVTIDVQGAEYAP